MDLCQVGVGASMVEILAESTPGGPSCEEPRVSRVIRETDAADISAIPPLCLIKRDRDKFLR